MNFLTRLILTSTILATSIMAPTASGQISVKDTRLTPPGPPQDNMMKTLDVVEPRIAINSNNTPGVLSATTYDIGRAGSYYLIENLLGNTGETGIWVYASNVTIDLNGFSLVGSTNAVPNNAPGIFVESNVTSVVIQNGTVTLWQHGIVSLASNLTVRNVEVTFSGSDGLKAGQVTRVDNSVFNKNLSKGVQVGADSLITDVIASTNDTGIVVGRNCIVDNCIIRRNVNPGIALQGPGTRVSDCIAAMNNDGIQIRADSCTILNCTTISNKSDGISIGSFSTSFTDCRIDGNYTSDNKGAGIYVNGDDNLVVRNVARDNVQYNYFIAASNQVGTIVSAIATNGVVGNSGGNLDATVGPWSNFAR